MSLQGNQITPHFATASRGRAASKPSVLKRLKKLVGTSHSTLPQALPRASSPTSPATQRRRAEALKSCGLLRHSVKYGGPYRDEEDDAKTIVSPERPGADTEKANDLLIFEDKIEGHAKEECSCGAIDESMLPACPPRTPAKRFRATSSASSPDFASTSESDSSTLAPRPSPVRIRRIGSLAEEISEIEDEESRRLTEVAFLC